jgi:Tfp pilus assembly protein PilF
VTQLPRQEDRRVIPRWRETATAVQLGEANSLNAAQPKETQRVRAQASVRLLELQTAFATHPSVGRAAELTGAATLLRQVDGAQDAAAFLLRHPHDTTPRVLQAARHILGQPLAELRPLSPPNMDELAPDDMHSEVRRLRADLKAFDRSPMAHVDLARMYAALGATRKAERHLRVALGLAPHHRLVLRAAVRFYVHVQAPDEAVHLLRRQPRTLHDPWLMAAEISSAMVAGLVPRSIKRAREVLDRREFHPHHISELAAALGTLELQGAKPKKVRRLLQQALEQPTENALAQVQWAAPQVRLDLDERQWTDVPRNFEAAGWTNYEAQQFQAARAAYLAWFQDEPFSAEPAILAGYLSHLLDPTPSRAIDLTRMALAASPAEDLLLNNMAFYLAEAGQLDLAQQYLARTQPLPPDTELGLTLSATRGLIAFRRGNEKLGRALYEQAIAAARTRSLWEYETLATLYYSRELARIQDPSAPERLMRARLIAEKIAEPGLVLTAQRATADVLAFSEA